MKPSDFYIGASELFSVLIPGFLVVYSILSFNGQIDYSSFGTMQWSLFVVSAYIVGHILFSVGRYWDEVPDSISERQMSIFDTIKEIRKSKASDNEKQINNFQWCKLVLSRIHPEGNMQVSKSEADSKLFRSMMVPLLILFIVNFDNMRGSHLALIAISTLIAFWQYKAHRLKAIRLATSHVIVLAQLGQLEKSSKKDQ